MEQSQYNFLFSFIWNIANDVLVNAFNKGDYKKVILPMLVLRRIDVLLEPTKDAVIQMKEQLDKNKIENQAPVLYDITGYPFYNTSKFTMKTLKSEIAILIKFGYNIWYISENKNVWRKELAIWISF